MKTIFEMDSRLIYIYLPDDYNKIDLLPVLYVLDGDAFAQSFAQINKLESRNSPKTKVIPQIIIGIGYGSDAFAKRERARDYTPAPLQRDDRFEEQGGFEEFVEFLQKLHQFIVESYLVDEQNIGIWGHSFGGLCVLELLVKQAIPFSHYAAISPSIWWDEKRILERIIQQEFLQGKVAIMVGENEGFMVPLAQIATEALQPHLSESILHKVFLDENHMSITFTSISSVLRWLWHDKKKVI